MTAVCVDESEMVCSLSQDSRSAVLSEGNSTGLPVVSQSVKMLEASDTSIVY